jgi:hypothetical protein
MVGRHSPCDRRAREVVEANLPVVANRKRNSALPLWGRNILLRLRLTGDEQRQKARNEEQEQTSKTIHIRHLALLLVLQRYSFLLKFKGKTCRKVAVI